MLLIVTTFFLVMNFKLLSIVSNQERRIICLAQMIAMLRHREQGADSNQASRRGGPLSLEGSMQSTHKVVLKRGA